MENNTEYIDDYFNGRLSPDERNKFEKQMEQDKNFAEQVAFYLAAKQALKEELATEKKAWFRQLASENIALSHQNRPTQIRKMWVYRIASAAVLAGIIFFSWNLFFHPSTSTTQMADKYINTNFQNLPVKMGEPTDTFQNALRLYNERKYDSSLQQLQAIILKDTSNFSAKKNAGIVSLRLGNYDKALMYFQQLGTYQSLYSNPAKLYQALTLLKRNHPGDKTQARRLLHEVRDQHLYGEETARDWLDKKW